jgi:general stress protein YciG
MDPNEQRRIARMGGEATARTHGRDFYEEIGHEGGRARWEEDEDDRRRGRSTSGSGRSSMGRSRAPSARSASSSGRRSTGSGRRGFGSMPREEVRRIARMGGRARWGEDYNDYDTGRRRRRGR